MVVERHAEVVADPFVHVVADRKAQGRGKVLAEFGCVLRNTVVSCGHMSLLL